MPDTVREHGAMTPEPDAVPDPRTRGATVLVVDCNPAGREAVRTILEGADYHIEEAVDGGTALQMAERVLPDVILLDADSCLQDVETWMREVETNIVTCDTPVILVCESEDNGAWAEVEALFDECLEKPIVAQSLLRRVRAMTRLRQHRHELVEARSLHGEQTRWWGVLLDFARSVDKLTDLDLLLERIVQTAAEMTSSRRVSLMLPDEQQQYLTIAKSIGLDKEIADDVRVPLGGAISGQAFASGRPVTTLEEAPTARREGYEFKSFVSMPMIYSTVNTVHQRVGVMNISNRYGDRPFEEWELEFIDLLGSISGSAIDEIHSRQAREALLRMERDLQLARQIQQRTFPDRLPALKGFEIDAWTEPAEETGGDTYDVIGYRRAEMGQPALLSVGHADRAVLMLADATGHGIGPALSVTQVRAMLRMAVRMQPELPRIARHLNEQLCADLPEGRFITAWLGELNTADRTLTSFSAGQGPILRYEAARNTVERLAADTMPFGITSDFDVSIAAPIGMEAGDILAVISDGIFEAADRQGAQFGTDRAVELITAHRAESPQQILRALRNAVAAFTDNAPADDDRTAIILKAA